MKEIYLITFKKYFYSNKKQKKLKIIKLPSKNN